MYPCRKGRTAKWHCYLVHPRHETIFFWGFGGSTAVTPKESSSDNNYIRFLLPSMKHKTVVFFSCKQRVEIKQKQLLFVRLSGENLQINLPVFPFPFQLGLSARLRPFMSLSQRPLWVCLCVHIAFIFCLHSALNRLQTWHDVYNKQRKSVRSVCRVWDLTVNVWIQTC